MSMLDRLKGKVAGTAKQAKHGDHGAHGTGDRNVGGREGGTPPPPPELPLDDDGNDARNIGG
jgi:hypothetical protein